MQSRETNHMGTIAGRNAGGVPFLLGCQVVLRTEHVLDYSMCQKTVLCLWKERNETRRRQTMVLG